MDCTVSRDALVRELALCRAVVEARTTIPILSNVLIEAAGDRVLMTSTDLESFLRCSLPAKVAQPGAVTVPAARLLDYVRLLPSVDIRLTEGDNAWLHLLWGRARTRMGGINRASFPDVPQCPEEAHAVIPFDLLGNLIAQTAYAISTEATRFALGGALLAFQDSALRMVATDGHRIALMEAAGAGSPVHFMVPRKAIHQLQKLVHADSETKEVKFYRAGQGPDARLFFATEGRVFCTREMNGNFPDYGRIMPKEQPHRLELDRLTLRTAIQRVATFSDEKSNMIRVSVAKGELRLQCSVAEVGECEDGIPVEFDGPAVEIGFNAKYLLDFLGAAETEKVRFLFMDAVHAGELQPVAGEEGRQRYVVMPMRV